ncbi:MULTISPECIES: FecR family protein [Niastella]|uniref:FecR family protein n=1 Tax=Niastella soli TaxID=2821487 RepID=A0ABS3YY67_9BACT|nr:FecR family protein [Niastella soli]MBO9202860.1 FecR family protein [Niastella soli]
MGNFLKNELLDLLQKARAGNATGDDYSRIAAIINADQSGELIAEADNFLAQEVTVPSQHIEPYNYEYWQRAFLEIKESWRQQNLQQAKVRRLPVRRWWVAASIMLLISVGVATYLFTKRTSSQLVAGPYKILPGKEGAILTLADGSQVLLDSLQNGIVAMQGGTTAKIVNGTLIYEGKGNNAVYNVMSTPKAREFHVILPDGTNAWLNSGSSLRYPTTFTGNERKVTVTGEVYFEVATVRLNAGLKMPFKVNVNNKAEIEVLGTHFNVKAYANEPVINTTLLEGSIAITLSPDQRTVSTGRKGRVEPAKKLVLKPGQQAQILIGQQQMQVVTEAKDAAAKKANTQPELTVVSNTDIDNVMAWKNGVFDFNNIAFNDAMSQLERWYDIEVVYEKGIPTDIELNGKISKDVTLNELVTILEKIGVKCRLEGRKLLIQS